MRIAFLLTSISIICSNIVNAQPAGLEELNIGSVPFGRSIDSVMPLIKSYDTQDLSQYGIEDYTDFSSLRHLLPVCKQFDSTILKIYDCTVVEDGSQSKSGELTSIRLGFVRTPSNENNFELFWISKEYNTIWENQFKDFMATISAKAKQSPVERFTRKYPPPPGAHPEDYGGGLVAQYASWILKDYVICLRFSERPIMGYRAWVDMISTKGWKQLKSQSDLLRKTTKPKNNADKKPWHKTL